MSIDVRAIEPDELGELVRVTFTAFGEDLTDQKVGDLRDDGAAERALGAVEDGRFVGAGAAVSFALTVPGGAQVPVAGVTWVGVLPTHRRRGALSSIMRRQLDDVAAAGEPLAVLTASEATIYNRFGYGLATRTAKVEVDGLRDTSFVVEPASGGRLRLVDADEAVKVFPPVRDAVQRATVGELSRPQARWDVWIRDREDWRDEASSRLYVVHEAADGTPDGYVAYRVKEDWEGYRCRNQVRLEELAAAEPEVEATLWRYLLDIDLKETISARDRRVDDPMRFRFSDSRNYRVDEVGDHLWVRVVDVRAALEARTYESDGTLVLGVDDPFRPATSGRYRLEVGDGGAAT